MADGSVSAADPARDRPGAAAHRPVLRARRADGPRACPAESSAVRDRRAARPLPGRRRRDAPTRPRSPRPVAHRRARPLDAGLVVDVLVVGGGVTGAGVALDAASRGLSVALLEAEDLAFGTSRWSSKLVHGGLRYLATGDVGAGPGERPGAAVPHGADRPAPGAPAAVRAALRRRPLPPRRRDRHHRDVRRGPAAPGLGHPPGHPARARAGSPAREVLGLAPAALPRRPARRRAQLGRPARRRRPPGRRRWPAPRPPTAPGSSRTAGSPALDGAPGATEVHGTRHPHRRHRTRVRARHVISATGVWADDLEPTVELTPQPRLAPRAQPRRAARADHRADAAGARTSRTASCWRCPSPTARSTWASPTSR